LNNVQIVGIARDRPVIFKNKEELEIECRFIMLEYDIDVVISNLEKPNFILCKAYGEYAEQMTIYINRGTIVAINGHIDSNYKKDKLSGEIAFTNYVIVDKYEILSLKTRDKINNLDIFMNTYNPDVIKERRKELEKKNKEEVKAFKKREIKLEEIKNESEE
jgi:single-stranded DNA-binding protein